MTEQAKFGDPELEQIFQECFDQLQSLVPRLARSSHGERARLAEQFRLLSDRCSTLAAQLNQASEK